MRAETKDKVTQGYARVLPWSSIKHNIPRQLKLSPVVMIPHKSKSYGCILDLSFNMRKQGEKSFCE